MSRRLPSPFALVALAGLLFLSGCQEFTGPVWSPTGRYVAYTEYRRTAEAGRWATDVLLADAEDETGTPLFVAQNAAFPRWSTEGPTLFFLGKRDAQGFYTTVMKLSITRKAAEEMTPEVALQEDGLKLVNMHVAADGSAALLCSSRDPRPGQPQTVTSWNPTAKEKTRTPLKDLGEVYSPVLTPNGRLMAFCQKPAEAGSQPLLAVLDLDRKPLEPKTVFPTKDYSEPNAASYVIHALPDNERFLFYAPGGKHIWWVRRDGTGLQKAELLAGYAGPVLVSFASDGKSATLTLARPAGRSFLFQAFVLTFQGSSWRPVESKGTELVGGQVTDPSPGRLAGAARGAWLSPGGLAIGTPGHVRFYPRSGDQFLAASAAYLEQKEAEKALKAVLRAREVGPPPEDPTALDLAEARAYLAQAEGAQQASESMQRAILAHPVGPAGLAYLFPASTGLASPAAPQVREILGDLDKAMAAAKEDQLLPLLRTALAARLEGKSQEAQDAYQKAEPLCPSDDLAGGVRFHEALLAIERGDVRAAGERFSAAARMKSFPQADYAAGLATVAYVLEGDDASARKAEDILRYGVGLDTPLKDALQRIPAELRSKPFKQKRSTDPFPAPGGVVKTWVDCYEYLIPQAFLKPTRVLTLDHKHVERRVTAVHEMVSIIYAAGLAEGTKDIVRIPRPISQPLFSPDGDKLAFLAEGEVVPLQDCFCAAYVVNLQGKPLAGDWPALESGRLSSRAALQSLIWVTSKQLRIKGVSVDVFGAETDMETTLAVP